MTPSVTLRPVTTDDEGFLYQLYSSTREQELARCGITQPGRVSWNLHTAALYEEALRRLEGCGGV